MSSLRHEFADFVKDCASFWAVTDETEVALSTALGGVLYADLRSVLQMHLQPKCATEEQMERVGVNVATAATLCKALALDSALEANCYVTLGFKHVKVGADNWKQFLASVKYALPKFILRASDWRLFQVALFNDVDDSTIEWRTATEPMSVLHECIRDDITIKDAPVALPTLRRLISKEYMAVLLSTPLCNGLLPFHCAFRVYLAQELVVEMEYLFLLFPFDLCVEHGADALALGQRELSLKIVEWFELSHEKVQMPAIKAALYFEVFALKLKTGDVIWDSDSSDEGTDSKGDETDSTDDKHGVVELVCSSTSASRRTVISRSYAQLQTCLICPGFPSFPSLPL